MALFRNTLLFSFTSILLLPAQAFPVDNVEQYLGELERAEEEYGAYDQSLADAYLGLGAAYEANLEIDEAEDAFLRGMHVQRVNNGLFDLGQIVYLEELSELEVGRDNWLEGAEHLTRAHAITMKNYPADSAPVLKSSSELIDLHLRAHSLGVEDWDVHLSRADFLNHQQIRSGGWGNEDSTFTQERLQRTAYINYEVYKLSLQQVMYQSRAPQDGFGARSTGPSLLAFFGKGKYALEQNVILLRDTNAGPELVAQGMAQVGDWYLLFDKVNGAKSYYKQAFDVYAGSEGEEAATALFSEPLQIPTFGIPGSESRATKRFRYNLDVTARGQTKRVRLLTDKEGHSVRDLRRASAIVRSAKFRPVLTKDGPAVKLDSSLSVMLE